MAEADSSLWQLLWDRKLRNGSGPFPRLLFRPWVLWATLYLCNTSSFAHITQSRVLLLTAKECKMMLIILTWIMPIFQGKKTVLYEIHYFFDLLLHYSTYYRDQWVKYNFWTSTVVRCSSNSLLQCILAEDQVHYKHLMNEWKKLLNLCFEFTSFLGLEWSSNSFMGSRPLLYTTSSDGRVR